MTVITALLRKWILSTMKKYEKYGKVIWIHEANISHLQLLMEHSPVMNVSSEICKHSLMHC